MWGAYFCMGAYKWDVVVVIKMAAYIQGMLILCGCLFLRYCFSRLEAISPNLIPTKLSGYIATLYFVKTESNYYLYTLNAT